MKIRIAINGFGRIGRNLFRALLEHPNNNQIELVAINEIAKAEFAHYLLQYDSVQGKLKDTVGLITKDAKKYLQCGDMEVLLLQQKEISKLPWDQLNIDLVLECTGIHAKYDSAYQHILRGAKRVLLSQPGKGKIDNTIINGFNHNSLKSDQKVISNASCTSNCLVPILKIVDDFAEIITGSSTTIHSAMADQAVNDSYEKEIHLSRSALQSIIPVPTQLAIGIKKFFPKLSGNFETLALRVPTINVSVIDVTLQLTKKITAESVNQHIAAVCKTEFKGIVDVTELPLVSVDYNHNPHSVTVDSSQTRVAGGKQLKLMLWFDNEWGFANRMLDTTILIKNLKTDN
jgi:D-erythrose 4-phosphate dehydrogenase